MSNELWNLHCTRSNDEESDFDSVTEWASSYILSLERRLAECQARNVVLRNTLGDIQNYAHKTHEVLRWANEALAMPSDSTALHSVLKAAKREALLERANYYETRGYLGTGHELARELTEKAKELK